MKKEKEMVKRKVTNGQIPLAFKALKEIKALVGRLKELGYYVDEELNHIYRRKKPIIAVMVDINSQDVWLTNITCMAGWCTTYADYPLYISEALEHFDELFVQKNLDLFNQLLESVQSDHSRPIGRLYVLESKVGRTH